MKINRDNYEAYFLDYQEGQLSPEMVEEVNLFVIQNPDLKTILDEFEAIALVADQDIVFEKKSSIKKNQIFATSQVNELNYEEYLVGEVEGLLNAEELSAIEEFISINPQFEKDRRLFALAHLTTDDIVFEAKESLKQKAIPVGAIDAETFETFMAREIEGDLNPEEKLQLAEFMQYNPHLEKDRKLYTHTILNTDTDIVFENKNSLKHADVIPLRRIVYYALSAAASLALIFSVYFLLDRNNVSNKLADQGRIKNAVNQVITEPAKTIPDKQVATNVIKPAVVIPTPNQNNSIIPNTIAPNNLAGNNQVQEPLASVDRHAIDILPTRTAIEVTTRSYVEPEYTFIRESQMYMNQNMEFYYNLKLNEELEYAEMYSNDEDPAKTIFSSVKGKVGNLFASNHKAQPKQEQKNVSLWTFAELGVKTFNSMTSSDVELNLKKNDEGKVVGYDLQGNLINVERDLKK